MSKVKLQALVLACTTSLLAVTGLFLVMGQSYSESVVEIVDLGADVATNFTITEDPATGYVTAENQNVKVVWHYKILWEEYNNRGGGNIYELYDKRTDPSAQRNLVAVVNEGTAGTSPPKAGIGGLGATYVYEKGYNVAIGDNGGQSRLVGKNHYIDGEGNAIFEASFIIKSKLTDVDSYRVDKKWTVFPSGQIKLDMHMTVLRSYEFSQIAYNFSFSQDYGWKNAVSKRHFWGLGTCSNDGAFNTNNNDLFFSDIDQIIDRDNSLMHTQSFSLFGQDGGVSASVKMDNNGQGFENGGLFGLGAALWGTTASPTSEYSNYSERAYGHTMRFYAWWGGDPPQPDRYRYIQVGTEWSDTIWIEMQQTTERSAPVIVGDSQASNVGELSATIEWQTSAASDSRVSYRPAGTQDETEVADGSWTPQHTVALEGLSPGVTYEYDVHSRDATGEAVDSGVFTTVGVEGVNLVPTQDAVQWLTFSDYLDRRLTVDFDITNIGTDKAYTSQALAVIATSGVSGQPVDSLVGDIESGQRRSLRIRYAVPIGVTAFRTTVYMRAEDASGNVYFFPEAPPAG